jgi:hypothetical protein
MEQFMEQNSFTASSSVLFKSYFTTNVKNNNSKCNIHSYAEGREENREKEREREEKGKRKKKRKEKRKEKRKNVCISAVGLNMINDSAQ